MIDANYVIMYSFAKLCVGKIDFWSMLFLVMVLKLTSRGRHQGHCFNVASFDDINNLLSVAINDVIIV